MTEQQEKFHIYTTIQRFLVYKITNNLRRIYVDIDFDKKIIYLIAYYSNKPTILEQELLDDIETNSAAHLPNYVFHTKTALLSNQSANETHEFVVFATYD